MDTMPVVEAVDQTTAAVYHSKFTELELKLLKNTLLVHIIHTCTVNHCTHNIYIACITIEVIH